MILLMILLCIIFIGRESKVGKDYLYAYIKAMILWTIFMYSYIELLSLGTHLTTGNLQRCWYVTDGILFIIVIICCVKRKLQFPKLQKPSGINMVFSMGIFLMWIVSFVMAMRIVPYNWDSLTYHLPRIMHWVQNQSVAHYATNIDRQIASPPLAEFINLHLYLLMGNRDTAFNLLQCMSYGTCIIIAIAIARRLGCNSFLCLLAGFLYATMPIAVAEAITTQNDEYATLWLMTFGYVIIDLYKNPKLKCDRFYFERTLILSCCIGFGYLTKPSFGFGVMCFAIALLAICLKNHSKIKDLLVLLCSSIMTILVIVIPEVIRNIQTFHGFSDPGTGARQLIGTLRPNYVFLNFVKNYLYNTPNLYFPTNNICESIICWLANRLNVILDDPAISEDGQAFQMISPGTIHHNSAINELVFWTSLVLMVMVLVILVCDRIKKKQDSQKTDRLAISFCIIAYISFLMLCMFMRWEPYVSRYMLTYLSLICVTIPVLLQLLMKRHNQDAICYAIIGVILFVGISEEVRMLEFHAEAYENSIEKDRLQAYFYICGEGNANNYRDIANEIQKQGYHNIGLLTGIDTFEYPLWYLLNDYTCRIEHISVNNMTKVYEDEEFIPDCIFVRDWEPRISEYDYHGQHYVAADPESEIGTYLLVRE